MPARGIKAIAASMTREQITLSLLPILETMVFLLKYPGSFYSYIMVYSILAAKALLAHTGGDKPPA